MRERDILAVVGNGMAGHRLCERLVGLGVAETTRIVVFASEPRVAYDRVHLGDVLRGRSAEALALCDADWYAAQGIELRLDDAIESIDLRRRTACSRRGVSLRYDRLALATGSEPIVPPISGLQGPGVFVYRTAEDAASIRAAALRSVARRGMPGQGVAGVLGGGLLGLEAARLLQQLGCRVSVFERAPHLLPRQLPADASRFLEARLRGLGIELRLAATVRRVAASEEGLEVDLGDGDRVPVDLLVVAVGVRPSDGLARRAGLAVHPEGGILVDDRLRTSDDSVFGVGECVRHAGAIVGLAAPALEMADVLAERLAGRARRYAGAPAATRLKVEDVELTVVGETLADGSGVDLLAFASAAAQRWLVLAGGRALGAVAIGAWLEWPRVQASVERRARLSARARARFERSGSPWRPSSRRPVAAWPDARIVCACAGVDCGALRAALAGGCRTAPALSAQTRAGTLCGSCRPLLDELVGADPAPPCGRVSGSLVVAALASTVLCLVLALATPVPIPASVRTEALLERLGSSSLARQATGFCALALCAGSLGLSLRKRWPRLRMGSFAAWRVVHGGLGVATLVVLVAHTGLRSGGLLDQWLLECLLVLSLAGAGAALGAGLEARLPGGSLLRRATQRAHVLAFLPLPALVLFHVLKVYWF